LQSDHRSLIFAYCPFKSSPLGSAWGTFSIDAQYGISLIPASVAARIQLQNGERQRTNPSLMMTMVLWAQDPPVTISTLQPMQIARRQASHAPPSGYADQLCRFPGSSKMTRKEKNTWR
jgi:hypothetical protein